MTAMLLDFDDKETRSAIRRSARNKGVSLDRIEGEYAEFLSNYRGVKSAGRPVFPVDIDEVDEALQKQ